MNRYLWVGCGSFTLLFLFATDASAGIDTQMNSDPPGTVQNEVRIAVDPGNSNNIFTAYNDLIGSGSPTPTGISYSSDGGVSWLDTQLSTPTHPATGATLNHIFDPYLAFAPGNNAYAGYIATTFAGGPGVGESGIFIERSTNGGATWSGPTTIDSDLPFAAGPPASYRFNDRPDMATNPAGLLGVTWIKDVGSGAPTSDIYFSWSNPPGASGPGNPTGLGFSSSITINDGPNGIDFANAPSIAMHPTGKTYVAWIDVNVTVANASTGTIKIDSTTLPAVGPPGPPPPTPFFGTDVNVVTIDPSPRSVTTLLGSPDSQGTFSYPSIAVDGNDPTGNTVYLTYAAEVTGTGDEGDIFFTKSTNGGTTWSTPLRVNDDLTTNDQVHPEIAVKPNGDIDIVWYDKRSSPSDDMWDVYITRSVNGGASFAPNLPVTDAPFLTPLDSGGAPWFGEYLGLTIDPNTNDALISFTKRGDTNGDVFFDRIPNSSIIIPEPTTLVIGAIGLLGLLVSGRRRGLA
jgi:hypothetical protein